MRKLKILMTAPLWRPIEKGVTAARPQLIFELCTRLQKRGHQVAILGTGDSYIKGVKIIAAIAKGLTAMKAVENPFYRHTAYLTLMLKTLQEKGSQFDIIHNHMYPEFLAFLIEQNLPAPMVTTIHAQVTREMRMVFEKFPQSHLVAISESAKRLAGGLENIKVIYNGVETEFFKPIENPQADYLFFIGRMSLAKDKKGNYLDPKGATTAIEVAERTGEKLLLVGNVQERKFYDQLIASHLSEKIKFVGPVSKEQALSREKVRSLMQNAKALLFPIRWEEPFGLVQVEAMACGTPVIGYNRGSVPEVVRDGVTGFVIEPEGTQGVRAKSAEVADRTYKTNKTNRRSKLRHYTETGIARLNSPSRRSDLQQLQQVGPALPGQIKKSGVEGMIEAVEEINKLSDSQIVKLRKACRRHVEENFSIEKMVDNYEKFYYQVLEEKG